MQASRIAGPSRIPWSPAVCPRCPLDIRKHAKQQPVVRAQVRMVHPATRMQAQAAPDKPRSDEKGYSKTIFLPKTDFPLRADAAKREKAFRDTTTSKLYGWQWNQKERPLFVLHDGPPYANGNLHMGHALNKILKDIVVRYKVLTGHRVHYIAGFDCHGLPIEHKALQQLEKDHRQLSPVEIRKVARKTAEKGMALQNKEFQDFGIMTQWDQSYCTLDKRYELRQLRVFQEMVRKGLIYRAERPVLWSPSSKTALAEAEISYKDDHVSQSVFVKFPIVRVGAGLKTLIQQHDIDITRLHLVVWTTTPWTLPANMFVAYSAAIEYAIVRTANSGQYWLLAAGRVDHLAKALGEDLETVCSFSGRTLEGILYTAPFRPTELSVSAASYVTADSGTGLVHSAPAHGVEDYVHFRAQIQPQGDQGQAGDILCPVDEDGLFTKDQSDSLDSAAMAQLAGMPVLSEGGESVIEHLRHRDLLVAVQKIRHKYPYDWRTKQPVIYRTTPQWFANLDKIKNTAVDSLQSINFVPGHGRNRLQAFVQGRSEWCISRQRAWGVPIPALYDAADGSASISDDVIEHILAVLEERGIDHWWEGPVEDFVPTALAATGRKYRKGTDTMDVWFDSGTSWTGLQESLKDEHDLHSRKAIADVYLEGSDQHRGWFQSSLLTSISVAGRAPFSNVVTHGFVLDSQGVKMSKSVGNVISPLTVINGGKDKAKQPAFGADVLRFWAASSSYTRDVNMSQGLVATSAEVLRKIRNTLRFILGNLNGVGQSPSNICNRSHDLGLIDRYVLHELHTLSENAREAYEAYEFNKAIPALAQYCASTLSAFYFERVRDILYCDQARSPRRQAVLFTLSQILPVITSIVAPVAPHLAEDVWQHWPFEKSAGSASFFESLWADVDPAFCQPDVAQAVNTLRGVADEVASLVEAAKQEKLLNSSTEASIFIETSDRASDIERLLAQHHNILPTLFLVSSVETHPTSADRAQGTSRLDACLKKSTIYSKAGQEVRITLLPAQASRCPRCRLHNRQQDEEGDLCTRCSKAVN